MSRGPSIAITIRMGEYGQIEHTVVAPLDERIARELTHRVELSDDPFSLSVAGSPGRDAIAVRVGTFKMRRRVADEIGQLVAKQLMHAFGENDVTDGYTRADLRSMEAEEPLNPVTILQGRNRTR